MLNTYKNITQKLTILFVFLSAFSINLPTRFMDISLWLLFIFWIISGDFKNKIQRIRENPGALVALGFFILMGLTIFYSSAPIQKSVNSWLRYNGLLLIPIIVSVLHKKKQSDLVLNIFLISSVIAVLGSYLKYFNLIPDIGIHSSIARNPVLFKYHIAHNIFIAFASYLMFCKLMKSQGLLRYSILILLFLFIFNVFFIVDSRTGQLCLLAGLGVFLARHKKESILRKYFLSFFLVCTLCIYIFSINTQTRIIHTIRNTVSLMKGSSEALKGEGRLELWANTLPLIKNHPFIGGGVGSLQGEYNLIPQKNKIIHQDGSNPHSLYLLIAHQAGILGLLGLFFFFLVHWQSSFKLVHPEYSEYFQALIIMMVISALFNCMFWRGEAHFYDLLAGALLSSYKLKTNLIKKSPKN